jgi:1-acyl-sn-glycerol-3-phosphate acyltransferase
MARLGPSAFEARDPRFIRASLPALAYGLEHWHRFEARGLEGVPDGAALVVGNHNGGIMSPDMFALMVAYWRRFGADAPAYGLMHDFVFRVPVLGATMARLGALPASPGHAREALARGAKVLVYPGGDLDAFKPYARRHEIVFGERSGFVRVALRARAPVVPVVSVGAHEAFHVLADGAELARRSGWKALTRMEVMPVVAGLPWGLWVGPGAYLPMPVDMKLHVLPAIGWPHLGPEAADDPATVARCREEVRATMQAALDALVAEGGFGRRPIFGGATRLTAINAGPPRGATLSA